MKIKIGTGPDSWGILSPSKKNQINWKQCLTEISASGYEYTELGPLGYFPTDPKILKQELANRNLKLSAVTVMSGHLDIKTDWKKIYSKLIESAKLGAELNAMQIVLIDDTYRDMYTGITTANKDLDEDKWKIFIENTHKFAQIAKEIFNLPTTFHPHAETHLETESQIQYFLEATDPDLISLLLDTGHHAYAGGNPISFFEKYSNRISYIHLKNVDPNILFETRNGNLSMAKAIEKEIFCEPDKGIINFETLSDSIRDKNYDGLITVEQDMQNPSHDTPLKIATRTRNYLKDIGLG